MSVKKGEIELLWRSGRAAAGSVQHRGQPPLLHAAVRGAENVEPALHSILHPPSAWAQHFQTASSSSSSSRMPPPTKKTQPPENYLGTISVNMAAVMEMIKVWIFSLFPPLPSPPLSSPLLSSPQLRPPPLFLAPPSPTTLIYYFVFFLPASPSFLRIPVYLVFNRGHEESEEGPRSGTKNNGDERKKGDKKPPQQPAIKDIDVSE